MNEFEHKITLTEEEYNHLLMLLGSTPGSTKQINYYYDTDDLSMNAQNVTCRLRFKNGKYQATMKVHMPDSYCSVEIDMPTPCCVEKNVFTAMGLKYQGKLITERTVLMKNSEFKIVLDKNIYLGVVDYEVEIEYSDSVKQSNVDILSHLIYTLHYEREIDCLLDEYEATSYFHHIIDFLEENAQRFNEKKNVSGFIQNKSQRFFQRKLTEMG